MKKIFGLLIMCLIVTIGCINNTDTTFGLDNISTTEIAQQFDTRSVLPKVVLKVDSMKVINGKTLVSVYAKSDLQNAEVFGINCRFFYDATDFNQFVTFGNFAGGYGVMNSISISTGNTLSKTVLGFDGAFRYCNTAIQLNNKDLTPILLDTVLWNRLFDIQFTNLQQDVSCAPLVWEKMLNPSQGGFLGGSEGLIITILAEPGTRYETAPTIAIGVNKNWKFNDTVVKGKFPYGKIVCE